MAASQSASLSWTAPASDGGSPITGYNVYRGITSGGESATPVAADLKTTAFTDPALTNGTTYYYSVAAVNAVGASPQSNETSVTPHATAPSAPLSLVASGGDSSVALSWTAPTSDGGSGVTSYDVYRGTAAGGESATPIATGVQTTTYTDASAVNGTRYYYKVDAVNAVNASPEVERGIRHAAGRGHRAQRPTEPDRQRRQHLGPAVVDATELERRRGDHRLQRLPRHDGGR